MQKMTFLEFEKFMIRHNTEKPGCLIKGVIVFTEDSFSKYYSLASRSYMVRSDSKMFRPRCCSNSLFGSALDGSDDGVNLSAFMFGADHWKVDYCYLLLEES